MLGTLKKAIKRNPIMYRNAVKVLKNVQRLSAVIPDETYIKSQHKRKTGKVLNLQNPQTFNEKLQWLKLNWRHDICTITADKFEVRHFVADRLGGDVLNELYAVYERPEDIEIHKLPKSFVLKVTHGSGQNVIVKESDEVDWKLTLENLKHYMNNNHYYYGREWSYKNITPRIVCERYLEEDGKPLKDYKFFCFNGVPKIVQVDSDRFDSHRRNMYDMDWNLLEVEFKYPIAPEPIQKPLHFDKMAEYAAVLSQDMPFVRVDFYHVNNKIYFGEMTFYPENATGKFTPDEYDATLGSYIQLPNK